MPWVNVDEPFADPPRAAGALAQAGDDGSVDLEDRWGSIDGASLDGDVDASGCERLEIVGSTLRGVRLQVDADTEVEARHCSFVDCELSAVRFTSIDTSTFTGCKLSGLDLGGAVMRDVTITESMVRLGSWRGAHLDRVAFVDSVLDDVDLYDARLSHVTVGGCSLRAVDVDAVHFDHVDLRGAVELDLRSCRGLAGCLVSTDQVVPLAHLFVHASGASVERPD